MRVGPDYPAEFSTPPRPTTCSNNAVVSVFDADNQNRSTSSMKRAQKNTGHSRKNVIFVVIGIFWPLVLFGVGMLILYISDVFESDSITAHPNNNTITSNKDTITRADSVTAHPNIDTITSNKGTITRVTSGCTFNSTYNNSQLFFNYQQLIKHGILSCQANDCSTESCKCTIRPGGILHSYFDARNPPVGCGAISIERNGLCEDLTDHYSIGCDFSSLKFYVTSSANVNPIIEKFICGKCSTPRNCAEIKEGNPDAASGVYRIRLNPCMWSLAYQDYVFNRWTWGIPGMMATGSCYVSVYCDMDTFGGGWTVFQKRFNGSVDFYRTWVEYSKGFGDLNGEFWAGNTLIHHMTSLDTNDLLIELYQSEKSCSLYANYQSFVMQSEQDKFSIQGTYVNGTASDSFSYHFGRPFSTKDRDSDANYGGSCAYRFHGAWWYGHCHRSNLNGRYGKGCVNTYADHMTWNGLTGHFYSFGQSEMKIRPTSYRLKSWTQDSKFCEDSTHASCIGQRDY